MWRREIAIAFGAPVTWVTAALGSAVVGHGFVSALDVFSEASRSALANALMARELDPLAGVVRPTLGGCRLSAALLVPVLAARLLAVEKERNTFGAIALATGSPGRVAVMKLVSAAAVASLVLVAPVVLLSLFAVAGGHLDVLELFVAFSGHVLHVALVATLSVAAAAWTRTVAQATTLAIVSGVASWAIEAGEGFSALAWMGPLEAVSVGRNLASFEEGLLSTGAIVWFASTIAAAAFAAWLGARFDVAPRRRAFGGVALVVSVACAIACSARIHRAYDWTELARSSLPPAAVTELRDIACPIEIEVWLDRDDSRRRQLERDALAKLRLARPDLHLTMPLDDLGSRPAAHAEHYGRIVVRVGGETRETRSTSRRELVVLIFETLGRPLPDWSQPVYPGYPIVVEGAARLLFGVVAYVGLPGLFLSVAWLRTRRGRRS